MLKVIKIVGRSKRRIFKIGDSKGITLPKEWIDKIKDKEVHVVFDKMLVIFDDPQKAEKFAEALIEKMTGVPYESLE